MGAQVVLPVCLYIPRSAKAAACGVSIEKAAVTHICFRLMGAACVVLPCRGHQSSRWFLHLEAKPLGAEHWLFLAGSIKLYDG